VEGEGEMNELRRLENLENQIKYLEELSKEQDLPNSRKDMYAKWLKSAEQEANEIKKTLGVSLVENNITSFEGLYELFDLFPENRRRSVNKIIQRGDYFNLVYNLNEQRIVIQKKDEIVFSAIPYDTARNYIQRAAVLTLLYPESTKQYLEKHKSNLMKYIKESLRQVGKSSNLAEQHYLEIFNSPLFMVQVLGRMLQHDETGPLSANLPGKFLYDVNQNTGITGYLIEFLKFVIKTTRELPIATDGEKVSLVDNFKNGELTDSIYGQVYFSSYSMPNLNLLPEKTQTEIGKELMTMDNFVVDSTKPMLRSDVGAALKNVRDNYIAHSIPPSILEPMFTKVLSTSNENLINVVSDIHSSDGKIPFKNEHFNILAGDLSDSVARDVNMSGIIVIGNHELSDTANKTTEKETDFDEYRDEYWFKKLIENPDESWPYLPIGSNSCYELIKNKLSSRFPSMYVINNEVFYYHSIRYIGLTVPVALVRRKLEVQQFIYETLKGLIAGDNNTPTVIVSHAPLFNELSMLSQKSNSYNPDNYCALDELYDIFEKNNIIGVIHGHHHIPASKGREKVVEFAGKKIFVVCSIYSKMNTGLELQSIIKQFVKHPKAKVLKDSSIVKKQELIIYKHDSNIDDIQNLYQEKKGNKIKFTVEKTISGKRHRKRFDEINDAIDYLNELNMSVITVNE